MSCFKSDGSLHAYLMLLFHISGVAGTRWPKGLAYNNGGLHYLLTNAMVVVATHTPCRGGGGRDDFSSARPNTEEGASQGPQSCKRYVSSCFAFRVTASWGAQSHNTVVWNRFAFQSTASWGAQSHNAVVSSRLVFHGVPDPGTWVVPTTSTSSVTLWLCVVA